MTDDLQAGSPATGTPGGEPSSPAALAPVAEPTALPVDDPMDWSWPPYAPLEPAGGRRFDCDEWAPSSIVRRPRLRLGRWTLLYRRDA